jgi:hypothetical protein
MKTRNRKKRHENQTKTEGGEIQYGREKEIRTTKLYTEEPVFRS